MLDVGENCISTQEAKNKVNLYDSMPCKMVNICYGCHLMKCTSETVRRPITLVRFTNDSKVILSTRESC